MGAAGGDRRSIGRRRAAVACGGGQRGRWQEVATSFADQGLGIGQVGLRDLEVLVFRESFLDQAIQRWILVEAPPDRRSGPDRSQACGCGGERRRCLRRRRRRLVARADGATG